MTVRIGKVFGKCLMCGSNDINDKENRADRVPIYFTTKEGVEIYQEPLTCNNCYAALTRYYVVKNRNKKANTTLKEFTISTAITAD